MRTETKECSKPSEIFRDLFGDIPEKKGGLVLEDYDDHTCRVHTKDGEYFDFEVHEF